MMMNRRQLLALLGGTGAALSAGPAFGQSSYSVRIGTFASESTGAVFYAQDNGTFAKHGIAAEFVALTGGASVASAMLGGSLDIGEADCVTLAIFKDKGQPFVMIAPGELHSNAAPTLAIVVKDPALKIGKDFNGKTMASNVSRGFGSLVANAWIDNNGGDSNTVKWIELPFPTLSAALQRGQIDGYCAPEPFVTVGMKAGGKLVPLDKNPVAPVILQGGWFATQDWISKNPGAARAFSAAVRETDAWANTNAAATAQILSKYSKIPVETILAMTMRGQYQTSFDTKTVQPLIDAAAKYGYISKGFPAAQLIANVG
jgi:NitT/TauT family transport system substrate-binding protein